MHRQALKKDRIISDDAPELEHFYEPEYSQRMFDCRNLPRLLVKEEMSCNAATD